MTNTAEMTWEEAVAWLRDQPDRQELVRACYFDDPLPEAAERFSAGAEWQAMSALLPRSPGHGLDLASGRGIAAYALWKNGWDVVAVEGDPSALVGANAIRELSAQTGGWPVVRAWGEALPFADDTFDLVLARQALHHAQDLDKYCAECARVLKPGGTFVATREHVIDRPGDHAAFLETHPLHRLYGGENAFAFEQYVHAMERAGLAVTDVLGPLDSPVNWAPAQTGEIEEMADAAWRWPYAMSSAEKIADLQKNLASPGKLYTFVARKPLPGENLEYARLFVLGAVLEARESALNLRQTELDTRQTELDRRQTELDLRQTEFARCSAWLNAQNSKLEQELEGLTDRVCRYLQDHGDRLAVLEDNIGVRVFKKLHGAWRGLKRKKG